MKTGKGIAGINPTDFGFSIVKLAAGSGALIWGIYHPFSAHDRVVFLWLIGAFFIYNLSSTSASSGSPRRPRGYT